MQFDPFPPVLSALQTTMIAWSLLNIGKPYPYLTFPLRICEFVSIELLNSHVQSTDIYYWLENYKIIHSLVYAQMLHCLLH